MNEIEYLNLRNMIEEHYDRKSKKLQIWACLFFIFGIIFVSVFILIDHSIRGSGLSAIGSSVFFCIGAAYFIRMDMEDARCFKCVIKIGNAWEDQKLTVKEVLAHEEFRGLFPLRDVDAENYVGAGHRSK